MKSRLAALVFLFLGTAAQAVPQGKAEVPQRIRLGGNVEQPKLIDGVQPVYPSAAREAKIQGTVKLHVVIAKDGTVQQAEVLSGHPLLVQAALDAVRKWRYQPTLLNGQPVEVDTTIDVTFSLQDKSSAPPPAPPLDPQLRADILHLVEVMRLQERSAEAGRIMFESLRPMLLKSLPPTANREKVIDAYLEKLLNLYKSETFTERVMGTYAKYFSDEDIRGLVRFYETPAGQHFNDVGPRLLGELNQIGQQMALENIPDILKQLCKEYPELQGQAGVCPEAEPQKKS